MNAPRTAAGALLFGRRLWRAAAGPRLRAWAQPAVHALAERQVRRGLAAGAAPERGPLLVSGLLSETKGVSEAARLTLRGLRHAGFDPVPHELRELYTHGPMGGGELPVETRGGVWLIHANAPEALHALASARPAAWNRRYRIGYWVYELARAPAAWGRVARAFHEIWAPSRFAADSLRAAGVSAPIRVMPHPVSLGGPVGRRRRADFGLPEDAFCVLAMGDLQSSGDRKNLLGAIGMFDAAFGADPGARLVIKTQSEGADPAYVRRLAAEAGARANVRVMAAALPRAEVHDLIASCDVLLSPHRAEGFGLALAEAFLLGTPALATGYSGNLDFMEAVPDLLIGHTSVAVQDASRQYRDRSQTWAEPDLSDGARRLQTLRSDPHLRRTLAAQGAEAVAALTQAWSPERLESAPLRSFIEESHA
jgi:glycosyltransferase involved in cell wall biosynthesis